MRVAGEGILTVFSGVRILAVIILGSHRGNPSFLTPDDFPMQLGYLPRKAGDVVKLHRHNKAERKIESTSEALFLRTGRATLTISHEGESVKIGLDSGSVVLLHDGAHGLEFHEDSDLVEVKQGPYLKADDKTYL